ncbi:MAG: hypothetical protein VSS75_014930 [Candidatus Parabeggiatoa sp.]|nr:hypothetical protein [Candidatus Parabeggiatoa sp.]
MESKTLALDSKYKKVGNMSQSQRWYKGFSYRGSPKKLVEQISNQVQQHNLSQVVPLLRMEKGVESRKPFYFFLAIESAKKGNIPSELSQSHLLEMNYFKKPILGAEHFDYEDIKSMVGIAHDVHDYTHNIPYQPEPVSDDNPFDFTTSLASEPYVPNDGKDLSFNSERLLYWLSALGAGSWESFKKACQSLELVEPKRILRRFKLLGHLESSGDGLHWAMSPTALVKVNSQSDCQEWVLCGQRSLKLVQALEQLATVTSSNQRYAPPCIQLQLAHSENLSDLIEQINAQFSIIDADESSSQLANILPDIETWQQNLIPLQGIVSSLYDWKYFDGNDFIECVSPTKPGMYQSFPREDAENRFPRTLFYDQPNNRWLQGDWYGLRFLALHHQLDKACIVHYDKVMNRLAIPLSQRWAELYERALVLASGQLPTYQRTEQSWWLVYERISPKLATQLTDKLRVTLTYSTTNELGE